MAKDGFDKLKVILIARYYYANIYIFIDYSPVTDNNVHYYNRRRKDSL